MKKLWTLLAVTLFVLLLGAAAQADVLLPPGLTEIDDYAFEGCISLTTVTIPDSVTRIGVCAFALCDKLETVTLSDSLTTIEMAAFTNCKSLTSVTIPNSVKTIGARAFMGCEKLENLSVMGETCFGTMSMADTPWLTAQAQAVADAVTHAGQSDYEKVLALHDWVTENSKYDLNHAYNSAESIFLYHTGMCQAYTEAYLHLLQAVGIESMNVIGASSITGAAHTWNLVKLDGEWYHVDCTWDDPVPDGNERHDYCCVPDEIMRQNHIWDESKYPAATDMKYFQGL